MKLKLDLETIEIRLKQQAREVGLDPKQIDDILKDLAATAEEEKQARDAESDGEKERRGTPIPVLVATGDHPDLERIIRDIPFFIVEVPDDIDHNTIPQRLTQATYAYNQDLLSKRGSRRKRHKRQPLETVGEAMEALPRTFLKPHLVKLRYKIPCITITTRNEMTFPEAGEGDQD